MALYINRWCYDHNIFDSRILTKGIASPLETHKLKRNQNSLIIGCSGSGKTTGFVYDAIRQKSGSIVVSDTKNNLSRIFTPELKSAGYNVMTIDFVNLDKSDGYNPLDYIRRYDDGKYNEQDVQKLAQLLCPVINNNDTFWEASAQALLTALIALVMEIFDPCLRNLNTVGTLAQWLGFLAVDKEGKLADNGMKKLREMFTRAYDNNNNSYACKCFSRFDEIQRADRTWSCIISYVEITFIFSEFNTEIRVTLQCICYCLFQQPAVYIVPETHLIDLAGKSACSVKIWKSRIDLIFFSYVRVSH